MTYKIHPVCVKNTRCHKTFLVKHFLFGALAWKTVDVRHKPFLFSLHLTCSVFQQGASSRPGPKHFSGRCDVPMLPAPVSLLFLQNSCTWMVLFQQRWVFFLCFGFCLGFFVFVLFCFEVDLVEMKRESHMKVFRIWLVPCSFWAGPEAYKD